MAYKTLSKKIRVVSIESKRWMVFKRFISDFSAMKDAPPTPLHIWDMYLVYAIALGVANRLLENIKKIALEKDLPMKTVSWYHTSSSDNFNTTIDSLETLISNISNSVSALSDKTSTGGSFSSGGGSGGGGGISSAG
jgi:uncharacterized membrane protein